MQILSYIIIGVWLLSAVFLTVFILLHSGRGTGVSEVLMSKGGGSNTLIEKNLDRLTVIMAVIFIAGLLLMMNFDIFPLGTIASSN